MCDDNTSAWVGWLWVTSMHTLPRIWAIGIGFRGGGVDELEGIPAVAETGIVA